MQESPAHRESVNPYFCFLNFLFHFLFIFFLILMFVCLFDFHFVSWEREVEVGWLGSGEDLGGIWRGEKTIKMY